MPTDTPAAVLKEAARIRREEERKADWKNSAYDRFGWDNKPDLRAVKMLENYAAMLTALAEAWNTIEQAIITLEVEGFEGEAEDLKGLLRSWYPDTASQSPARGPQASGQGEVAGTPSEPPCAGEKPGPGAISQEGSTTNWIVETPVVLEEPK